MASSKDWIGAMRLRTLPLSLSNILLGNALALLFVADPFFDGKFSWVILGLTLTTTLFLQILSNFANDYGDFSKGTDNKDRVGPARSLQSGVITKEEMKKAIVITAGLALTSGCALLYVAFKDNFSWQVVVLLMIGLAAIAAAIKYTVGKKAYGYSGFGDLFVFIFFGLVGVLGSYYLQTKHFAQALLLPAFVMGAFSVAVLNLNNMRDIVNDKKMGKRTLVVKLGFKRAKQYHYLLFVMAYFCFAAFLLPVGKQAISIAGWFSPVIFVHLMHLREVYKTTEPKDLDPQLKIVALSAFFFGAIAFGLALVPLT